MDKSECFSTQLRVKINVDREQKSESEAATGAQHHYIEEYVFSHLEDVSLPRLLWSSICPLKT